MQFVIKIHPWQIKQMKNSSRNAMFKKGQRTSLGDNKTKKKRTKAY